MARFGMTIYTKIGYLFLALSLCISACQGGGDEPEPITPVLAFPGAEGGGSLTNGGRGGVVIHVTTLEDSRDKETGQPTVGTLRRCCNRTLP